MKDNILLIIAIMLMILSTFSNATYNTNPYGNYLLNSKDVGSSYTTFHNPIRININYKGDF